MKPALDTATYSKDIVAGCGDTWVGLRKTGGANGADFVLDNFTVTDLGAVEGGAPCARVTVPPSSDLSPGTPSQFTTSFTNDESTKATNVGLALSGLPDGWSAQVEKKGGNLFDTVESGRTVTTTWILTPPASAAGKTADFTVTAKYFNDCVTKTVKSNVSATVSERAMLSPGSMTATADSENLSSGPGEGPVGNVLDGNPSTIWHTDYTNSQAPYPHEVTFALTGESEIDGFGYLDRPSGPNGKVKDYTVSVSDTGTDGSWTQVASGTLVDSPSMQSANFDSVTANFVKFTAKNALNGNPFASAAEMRIYGTSAATLSGVTPGVRGEDVECGTGDTPLIDAPSSAAAGSKITIDLSGFPSDADLTVSVHSDPITLGKVTTNNEGAASLTATIPVDFATGAHVVRVSDRDGVLAEKSITITAAGSSAGGSDNGNGDGSGAIIPPGQLSGRDLARTGSDLLWPIGLALLMVLAGGATAITRRRRLSTK